MFGRRGEWPDVGRGLPLNKVHRLYSLFHFKEHKHSRNAALCAGSIYRNYVYVQKSFFHDVFEMYTATNIAVTNISLAMFY